MAILWTMYFWMAFLHNVCKDETEAEKEDKKDRETGLLVIDVD